MFTFGLFMLFPSYFMGGVERDQNEQGLLNTHLKFC